MQATNVIKRLIRENFLPQLNTGPGKNTLPSTQEIPRGIPKVIHQLFPSKELPPVLAENVDRLKAMNPGWEHKLYDHVDHVAFIREFFGPRILEYYERINPRYGAARAVLFRYLLLYQCGGVYLDIKSTAQKPFSEVIRPDDSYVLANSGKEFASHFVELANTPHGEILQWHIIAAPKHPFLKAVIEAVLRNIDVYSPTLHGVGRYGVFRLTGPVAYSLAIGPMLHGHSHRLCDYRLDLGLVYSIYESVTEHRNLFSSHYALLKEPIIDQNSLFRVREASLRTAKKIKDTWLPSL